MLLYNIKNVDKLYSVLDRCSGNVELTLPDGNSYDWKTSRKLVQSITSAMPVKGLDNVSVKLEDQCDFGRILSFMMQAA